MAVIRGQIDTGNILSSRLDFDWSGIYERKLNQATLAFFLQKLGKEQAIQPKFDHFEDELVTDTVTVKGAQTVTDTTIELDDASPVVVGDVLHNPATGENMYVSAVDTSANTVTVTRGFGGTTAAAIADDAELKNIGSTFVEGGTLANPVSSKVEQKTNYCQIFKKTVELTGTLLASKTLGTTNEETYRIDKAEREFLRGINYAFIYGSKSVGTLNGKPFRQTGGLIEWISTNVVDNSGNALTEGVWDDFLRQVFDYGDSDERLCICSSLALKAISGFAKNKLQVTRIGNQQYGVNVVSYVSPWGTVQLVHDRTLRGSVYGAYVFCLDLSKLKYKVLREVKFRRNVQDPGYDGVKHEFIAEVGLKVIDERSHGILKNFTA